MRIGEICVRVLNKNLLHICHLNQQPCPRHATPRPRTNCLPFLGQMEKNRRASLQGQKQLLYSRQ